MSDIIKILMAVPSSKLKMGGPTTHLPYLVEYFEQSKDFKIRTFDYGSKIDGGSLIGKKESVTAKLINLLFVFITFISLVIVYRPHIIHINTAFDKRSLLRDLPFSIFCFLFRQKLIFKIHGSSDLINTDNKLYRCLIKMFFLGAIKVGVLSEVEKDEFIKNLGNSEKLTIVKNIVVKREISSDFGFPKDARKIYALFVSRIVAGKGLEDIIRALPLILKSHSNFILIVAGNGPEMKTCMDLATRLDVSDSITWLGFITNENIPSLISSCDIFLFSSHLPEGMPMSLVEALMCGVPIITTRVRFARNYLCENTNCLFIQAGDVKDISDKVHYLISNKHLQEKMKYANPKLFDNFSQAKIGSEFESIYKQMLCN